jgi:ankyrin repeat protein
VNYAKPLSGNDDSMYSYLEWVETANNISISASFSFDKSYSYGGESLLHVAAKSGHLSMLKMLLEKGANVNIQDESGNTALHYSAANGKKDAVKFLLEKSADPLVVNVKEQKAIDYSNIKGFNEITELLLKFGPSNNAHQPVKSTEPVENSTGPGKNDMAAKKQALLDLKELLDAGILSQEEFDAEKTKILKS